MHKLAMLTSYFYEYTNETEQFKPPVDDDNALDRLVRAIGCGKLSLPINIRTILQSPNGRME